MAKARTQTGRTAIRALWEDAQAQADDEAETLAQPLDPMQPRYDPQDPERPIGARQWPGYPDRKWPPKWMCPVEVIGRDAATGLLYCLTATGHLRAIDRFDDKVIGDVFAPRIDDAKYLWPAWSKPKQVFNTATQETETVPARIERVESKTAMWAFQNEAARRGDFNPSKQHRGRGGWRIGEAMKPAMLWHSGRWLWTVENGKLLRIAPTMVDGFLYTRQEPTVEPWRAPVTAEESPAQRILSHLKSWRWARPYLDPLLVTGWLGVAIMGAALNVRPHIFATGGFGIGKSTLHELLQHALAGMMLEFANTTAASIYQHLKQDCLPVLLDELEKSEKKSQSDDVIGIMRIAYSGGKLGRGGAEGVPSDYTARSAFFGAAINPPKMDSQDKSRMAVLNLRKLDIAPGAARARFNMMAEDGRMLLRQCLDGFGALASGGIDYYWQALSEQGLNARACDTYATLLASCQMLVGPKAMEECGLDVADHKRLGEVVLDATALERLETMEHWHKCLQWLLDSPIAEWKGGERPIVGQVIADTDSEGKLDIKYARERLAAANLGLCERGHVAGRGYLLAVPRDGPALQAIFRATDYNNSAWWDILKQAEGVVLSFNDVPKGKDMVKIAGTAKRCLLVDLDAYGAFVARLGE